MQLKCPACNAGFSLEAALALDAGRSALLVALQMPAPLGMLLAQYLGMFRAAGRALSFDRTEKLLAELQPSFDKQTVSRNGVTRACTVAMWQQALERMIEQRNAGKLQLPLKTHGYLYEIAFGLADSADAKVERATEQSRQRGDARAEGDRRAAFFDLLEGLRGEVRLGLRTRESAEQKLRDAGHKVTPETFREFD